MMQKLSNWINNKLGFDGLLHIVVASIITIALNMCFGIIVAVIGTSILSILKEIYDHYNGGTSDKKDLFCDLIGIIIGIL